MDTLRRHNSPPEAAPDDRKQRRTHLRFICRCCGSSPSEGAGSMIEVELKFEIPTASRALLQEKIGTVASVRQLGQIDNSDIYYDTANFDCLQQAVFIRIRNGARLELKFHTYADPANKNSTDALFPF